VSQQLSYTAFADSERIAHGDLKAVAVAVKTRVDAREPRALLVFADQTGAQIDLDLRGDLDQVLRALEAPAPAGEPDSKRGRGRPKLGVVGREVTLLPRHWEWLKAQPGGASVALRNLVEKARSGNQTQDRLRTGREAVYRFMSAMAGNEAGFEEASRALFAGDGPAFADRTRHWPPDVREFLDRLAVHAFDPGRRSGNRLPGVQGRRPGPARTGPGR